MRSRGDEWYLMNVQVLTIFPELFDPFWGHGMVRRAVEAGLIDACALDIRDFTSDRHRTTDDRPYGGGCGMVMKPEPLALALEKAKKSSPEAVTIFMSPQGRPFDQALAENLALRHGLIFICGRYEGVDERICNKFVDLEISIGDYVLTGGEIPAMAVIDSVVRLIPGVLGGEDSAEMDSFTGHRLEHAHYTRPANFNGDAVPDVLLAGNHAAIDRWRLTSSLIRTFLKRPDLLIERPVNREEAAILHQWCNKIQQLIGNCAD